MDPEATRASYACWTGVTWEGEGARAVEVERSRRFAMCTRRGRSSAQNMIHTGEVMGMNDVRGGKGEIRGRDAARNHAVTQKRRREKGRGVRSHVRLGVLSP